MRPFLYISGLIIASTLSVTIASSFVAPPSIVVEDTPRYVLHEGVTPELSSVTWLLFDARTGKTILGSNEGMIVPIASVSKLLTAEVTLQDLDLSTTTEVSEGAVNIEGKAGRLKAGEIMSVRELLFPLLIESSNDAAEVIKEVYEKEQGEGQTFPERLTIRAQEIGMKDTVFRDPSGLSSENRSTALDLAVLLRHLFTTKRYILDITTLSQYIGEGERHEWYNNNPVYEEVGYVGGKHGFTDEAGRTFAGIFNESVSEDGERPIGLVILGSKDLKKDVAALRSYVQEYIEYR